MTATDTTTAPLDGEQFVAYDDEPRWIGAAWPTSEWVERKERSATYAAEALADAVLDGVDRIDGYRIEWRREEYAQARAEARHVRDVYDRLHVIAPTPAERTGWQFPGALVREL